MKTIDQSPSLLGKIDQPKKSATSPCPGSSFPRWFEQVGETPGPCPSRRCQKQSPKANSLNILSPAQEVSQTKMEKFVSDACHAVSCVQPMKKRRREAHSSKQSISHSSKLKVSLDRISCPLSECGNFGGRGYKRSYIVKHLNSHADVLKTKPEERQKLEKVLSEFSGHICCKNCCLVVGQANNSGLCRSCAVNSSISDGPIAHNLTDREKHKLIDRIRSANKTRLRILSDIPKSLRRLWGDCVSAILFEFAKAKTELKSFAALEKGGS